MRGGRALLVGLVAVLTATGLWFLVRQPLGPPPTGGGPSVAAPALPTSPDGSSSAPRTSTSRVAKASAATCRVGNPKRLIIRSLGVDAAFERIGLDRSVAPDASGRRPLGNPVDRTKAGWYAAGPRPGSGTGTVLTNGHTFRNNSAIFKEDFASRIAVGQRIDIRQDNGSLCSYRVAKVWREVNAQRDYPKIVTSQNLYDFSGPERLFLTTCGGSWNVLTQSYEDISLLVATPINRP